MRRVTPDPKARLVDRLACDAAEDERKRIACDIHDNVIQPYIGIQMSIAALKQKLVSGEGDIRPLLDKLDGMVDEGLGDLRRYIHGLDDSSRVGGSLLPAIRRFAARFSEATGIEVQVESGGELPAGRKLHGELFQMASEGLSNIHKHTAATRAIIRVIASENGVSLEIENNGIQEAAAAEFMPHTIAWRAKALGGEIRIEQCSSDSCRVVVQVPR